MKNVQFKRPYGPKDKVPPFKGDNGKIMKEIAILGRSNVGKSSLINHVCGNKTLAKTSSVPGKTQTINIFTSDDVIIADLPGYGYAKVPQEMRAEWGPMIEGYLKNRPSLELVLFLFDLRRLPSDEDIAMYKWLCHFDKKIILIFTKSDKIPGNARQKQASDIMRELKANAPYILFTTKEGHCKEALLALINENLRSSP